MIQLKIESLTKMKDIIYDTLCEHPHGQDLIVAKECVRAIVAEAVTEEIGD